MHLTKPRRLALMALTIPAMLAGGTAVAGATNAAGSGVSQNTAAATHAMAVASRTAKRAPKACGKKYNYTFAGRTDILGHRKKLIGHVSLYLDRNVYMPRVRACVITWRNGVARNNVDLTRVNYVEQTPAKPPKSRTRMHGVRSGALATDVTHSFRWWGSLRYKGDWYHARKKLFRAS